MTLIPTPHEAKQNPQGGWHRWLNRCTLASAFLLVATTKPHLFAAGLTASDGISSDYFGYSVSVSGDLALIGAYGDNIHGMYSGSAYLFRGLNSSQTTTAQQDVKFTPSSGATSDVFGSSVSLSGNMALIGAAYDDQKASNAGAAYVFRDLDTATGPEVQQTLKLIASDGVANDYMAYSVSLSGNMALLGADGDDDMGSNSGSAYLYRGLNLAVGPVITQDLKLLASDGSQNDAFGWSVSLSGSTALVGAYGDDDNGAESGSAYLFRGLDLATGATTTETFKLLASDGGAYDYFGWSVSVSGNMGIVSAYYDDDMGSNAGAAYLFRNLTTASSGTILTQDAKLLPSDGQSSDTFGRSLSLSGSTAIIGANLTDDIGINSGAAYLFLGLDTASANVLYEDVKIFATDGVANDNFGYSVSIDGDQFVVGAHSHQASAGKAYYGSVNSLTTSDAGNSTQTISQLSFKSRTDWIIGDTTANNRVIFSVGDSAEILNSGKGIYIGKAGGAANQLDLHGSVKANFASISGAGSSLYLGPISTLNVSSGTGISVNSGAVLKGSGTVTGLTTVASGGKISPGNYSASTLSLGSLTLNSGGILEFGLGTSSTKGGITNDFLQVNGDLTLSGKVDVLSIGASGTYHLIDYTGFLLISSFTLGEVPAGFYTGNFQLLTTTPGEILLSFDSTWTPPAPPTPPTPPVIPPVIPPASTPDTLYWDGSNTVTNHRVDGGEGHWSTTSSNWTTSTGASNHAWNSKNAVFSGSGATVTLTEDVTFQKIEFQANKFVLNSLSGQVLKSTDASLIEVATGVTRLNSDLQSEGAFTKTGAGELILAGQNSRAASTTVGEGKLHIAEGGTFASSVTVPKQSHLVVNGTLRGPVNNTGQLSGAGSIAGSVTGGGVYAPGNSPGTLTILGDFTPERNATLQIEVASPTVYDRLIVGGTATLNGTLEISALGKDASIGQQMLFLEANQIVGEFSEVIHHLPNGNRVRVVYTAQGLALQIAPDSYALVARNSNEKGLAKALNSFLTSSDPDAQSVAFALDLLNSDQYEAAFKAISPDFYDGVLSTGTELSHSHQNLIHQQLHARRLAQRISNVPAMPSAPSAKGAKAVAPEIQPQSNDYRWSAWTQASGLFSRGGLSLNPGEDFESGTIAIGADYLLTEHSAVGAFVSYQEGWGNYDHGGDTDLEAVRFGVYATYQRDGWYANAILGGGQSSYDIERPIVFSNLNRTAVSEPDAWEFFTSISLGYDVQVGNWTFGPQASLNYSKLHFGNFAENGAGALDLYLRDLEVESLRSYLGARVAYTFEVNDRFSVIPEVRAFWERDYIGGDSVTAQLNGGSGANFTHHFKDPDEDSLALGAGVGFQFGERVYANVYYNADFGRNDDTNHVISVSATVKF